MSIKERKKINKLYPLLMLGIVLIVIMISAVNASCPGNDCPLNISINVIDVTNPNATLTSPLNNSHHNLDQNFTVTLSDDNGLSNATLYIYDSIGSLYNQTTVTFTGVVVNYVLGIPVSLVDGIYHWFYDVFDTSGNNFVTENNTLTIDTIYPLINFISPTPNNNTIISSNIFNISVETSDINLANVTFNLYNSTNLINSTIQNKILTGWQLESTTDWVGSGWWSWQPAENAFDGNIDSFARADGTNGMLIANFSKPINTNMSNFIVTDNYGEGKYWPRTFIIPTQCFNTYSDIIQIKTYGNGVEGNYNYACFNTTGDWTRLINPTGGNAQGSGAFVEIFEEQMNNYIVPSNNYSQIFSNLIDGIYYYNVTSFDLSNNENSTETRKLIIDTISPSINIVYPTNIIYTTNVSTLNYTTNADNCWYSLNNGVTNTSMICGNNLTGLIANEGSNTWKVYVNDTAGNVNSSSVTFTKRSFSAGDGTINNPYQIYTWDDLDNVRNSITSSYILMNDLSLSDENYSKYNTGIGWVSLPNTGSDSSVPIFSGNFNGQNHVIYNLYSNSEYAVGLSLFNKVSGNISNLGVENFSYNLGDGYTGGMVGQLNAGGMVNNCYVKNGNIASREGMSWGMGGLTGRSWGIINNSYVYNVVISGNTGVQGLTQQIGGTITNSYYVTPLAIRQEAPVWYYGVYTNNVLNSSKTTEEMKLISTFANWNITTSLTDLNDGYPWLGWENNDSSSTWFIYELLDVINPNVTLILPLNNTITTNTSINFTSDLSDETGLANYTLYIYNSTDSLVNETFIDLSTNPLTSTVGVIVSLVDGIYHWFYSVFDTSGNSNISENNTLTIDTIAPNMSFIFPVTDGGTYNALTWTDIILNYDDAISCQYSPDYVNWFNFTSCSDTSNYVPNEGNNFIIVQGTDVAGNTNGGIMNSYTYDTISPSINIVYPTNIIYTTNISTLNYTTDADNCWYSLNDGLTNTSMTCGNNLTGLTSNEGSNTWTVYVNDTAGNVNSSSVTFFKDTIAPTISITYPLNTNYNIDVTTLNYITNADNCWYSLNNGVTNTSMICGNNLTGLISNEGSNTWKVYVNDTVGNINSNSVTFTKDYIPTISFVSPTPLDSSSQTSKDLYVNITTSDTNLKNNTIYLFNSTRNLINSSLNNSANGNYIIFTLPDGVYYINSTSYDSNGNSNSTETRTITIYTAVVTTGGGTTTTTDTSGTGWISTGGTQQIIMLNVSTFTNISLYSMNAKFTGVTSANEGIIIVSTKDINNNSIDVEKLSMTNKDNFKVDYKITRISLGEYEIRFLPNTITADATIFNVKVTQLSKELSQDVFTDISLKQGFFPGITGNAVNTGALKDFFTENWLVLLVFLLIFIVIVSLISALNRIN